MYSTQNLLKNLRSGCFAAKIKWFFKGFANYIGENINKSFPVLIEKKI
jgi:hypothetical protein